MADTTIRECKQCGNDFDSIYQLDKGVCDDCIVNGKTGVENFAEKYIADKRRIHNFSKGLYKNITVAEIRDMYEFQFGKPKDITGFYDERTTEVYVLSRKEQKIGEFFLEIIDCIIKEKNNKLI